MAKYEVGELTQIAKNNIEYFEEYDMGYMDFQDEDEIMKSLNSKKFFVDGIIERIVALGYTDKIDDIPKILEFILDKFEEHHIKMIKKDSDNTKITIKNWLMNNPPNDSEQSRPNVYKLCFALEMDAAETEKFFLKKYLTRPFNFKDYKEAVYFFCLNTDRSYEDAVRLIDLIGVLPEKGEEIETRLIGAALEEITEEEDFLYYMEEHKYSKIQQHATISKEVKKLIDKSKELAGVESISGLIKEIYGEDIKKHDGIAKSDLPQVIKVNFPSEMKFYEINKNTASNDTYRKTMILLYFYKFYKTLFNNIKNRKEIIEADYFQEKFEQFEESLDELLDRCGYVQLYWRNPFDRLILHCASEKEPLEELKFLLKKYYFDVVDQKSRKSK